MATTTSSQTRRSTSQRKTFRREELTQLRNRISKRAYGKTPQQERAFLKNQIATLLGEDTSGSSNS